MADKFVEIHRYKCVVCNRVSEIEGEDKPILCPSILCPNHQAKPNAEPLLPWQIRKVEEAALRAKAEKEVPAEVETGEPTVVIPVKSPKKAKKKK